MTSVADLCGGDASFEVQSSSMEHRCLECIARSYRLAVLSINIAPARKFSAEQETNPLARRRTFPELMAPALICPCLLYPTCAFLEQSVCNLRVDPSCWPSYAIREFRPECFFPLALKSHQPQQPFLITLSVNKQHNEFLQSLVSHGAML